MCSPGWPQTTLLSSPCLWTLLALYWLFFWLPLAKSSYRLCFDFISYSSWSDLLSSWSPSASSRYIPLLSSSFLSFTRDFYIGVHCYTCFPPLISTNFLFMQMSFLKRLFKNWCKFRACVCVHMHEGAHRGQKRQLDSWELRETCELPDMGASNQI